MAFIYYSLIIIKSLKTNYAVLVANPLNSYNII